LPVIITIPYREITLNQMENIMKKLKTFLLNSLAGISFIALLGLNIQIGFTGSDSSDTLLSEFTFNTFTNPVVAQTEPGEEEGEGECRAFIITCSIFPLEQVTHCVTTGDGVACNCGDAQECP